NPSSLPPPFHSSEPPASSSRRPPAPQEPKVSGGPYAMATSSRFGPTHNYAGGYQRGQHGNDWVYGSNVTPVSSPLSTKSYSHAADYVDHPPSIHSSAASPFDRAPSYASSVPTPTSTQFPS